MHSSKISAENIHQLCLILSKRHYGVDAQILLDLKVASIRLLTNNPEKLDQLAAFGITISERVPLWVGENHHNKSYLETKESKLGHLGSTG